MILQRVTGSICALMFEKTAAHGISAYFSFVELNPKRVQNVRLQQTVLEYLCCGAYARTNAPLWCHILISAS